MKQVEKKIVVYIADDGKEFTTRTECENYEKDLEIRNGMKAISLGCAKRGCCEGCLFRKICNQLDGEPEYWEI